MLWGKNDIFVRLVHLPNCFCFLKEQVKHHIIHVSLSAVLIHWCHLLQSLSRNIWVWNLGINVINLMLISLSKLTCVWTKSFDFGLATDFYGVQQPWERCRQDTPSPDTSSFSVAHHWGHCGNICTPAHLLPSGGYHIHDTGQRSTGVSIPVWGNLDSD